MIAELENSIMYQNILRRLVIVLAAIVALISFAVNMMAGADFFDSAFRSLCVLFASAVVFMVAFKAVAQVLFKHLEERKRVQKMIMPTTIISAPNIIV